MREKKVCLWGKTTDSLSNDDPVSDLGQIFLFFLEPTGVVINTLDAIDSHEQPKDSSFHGIQVPEVFVIVNNDDSDDDGNAKETRQEGVDSIHKDGVIHEEFV